MQQLKQAQSHQPQEQALAGYLFHRILGRSPHTQPPKPSNAEPCEDSKLDERVRESGEW